MFPIIIFNVKQTIAHLVFHYIEMLFVLSVYYFPTGVVGRLRLLADTRRAEKTVSTGASR